MCKLKRTKPALSGQLVLAAAMLMSTNGTTQEFSDLDSDGVADLYDLDQDNDGINNKLEGLIRLERLSDTPVQYYDAIYIDGLAHTGLSHSYPIIDSQNGVHLELTGTVLNTNTRFDWSMHEALPKFRNLDAGSSTVEWRIGSDDRHYNFDLTITDLDGLRDETITVVTRDIVGYSLSHETNVSVVNKSGLLKFTGTGVGRDSINDAVTLHVRQSGTITLAYSNTASELESGTGAEIAGYRHSLKERIAGSYFFPTTRDRDTDADGIPDHRDLDSDNDGLGDVVEANGADSDNNNIMDGPVTEQGLPVMADPNLTVAMLAPVYNASITVTGDDFDRDGILSSVDALGEEFGGSVEGIDSDIDGLLDLDEILQHRTDPLDSDTDNDGLTDQSELQVYATNPLKTDTDDDGLSDSDELMMYETNPNIADTDSDGVSDAMEIQAGSDPLAVETAQEQRPTESSLSTPTGVVDISEPAAIEPLMFDDSMQSSSAPVFQTGLNGAPGCSTMTRTRDPLLPVLLGFAIINLLLRKKHA